MTCDNCGGYKDAFHRTLPDISGAGWVDVSGFKSGVIIIQAIEDEGRLQSVSVGLDEAIELARLLDDWVAYHKKIREA